MNRKTEPMTEPMTNQQELTASLARLGIKELEERMEVSPLLAGGDVQTLDRCICESCCSTVDVPTPYDFPIGDNPYTRL